VGICCQRRSFLLHIAAVPSRVKWHGIKKNAGGKMQERALKKPNAYGVYDMTGMSRNGSGTGMRRAFFRADQLRESSRDLKAEAKR